MRIFVVEDHPATLTALKAFLRIKGHTVDSAVTFQEARRALPEANPDVLISDINLPDGSGWDLLNGLKLDHTPYTIAISGNGMPMDRVKSLRSGFNRHLTKPFALSQLAEVLENVEGDLGAK